MGGGQSHTSTNVRQSKECAGSGCESLKLEIGPDGRVTLKTLHGTFISVKQNGTVTTASSWGEEESFTLRKIPNSRSGKVSFRSAHGGYLRADWNGGWDAKAQEVSGWEAFTMVAASDGTVALKTFHGTYLSADPPSHPITGVDGTELDGIAASISESSSDSSSESSSDSSSGPEGVIVGLMSGHEFEVHLSEDDTVVDIKSRIARKWHIPQRSQKILSGSAVALDYMTVAELRGNEDKLRVQLVLQSLGSVYNSMKMDGETKEVWRRAEFRRTVFLASEATIFGVPEGETKEVWRPGRDSEGQYFRLRRVLREEHQQATEGVAEIIRASSSAGDGTNGGDGRRGRRSQRARGRYNRRRQQMASPGRADE